jgi:Ca2+-binding EF-hand superfamily protein
MEKGQHMAQQLRNVCRAYKESSQEKERIMINGIGSVFSAALPEMTGVRQQIFNLIDTSGDGSIDKGEVTNLLGPGTSPLVDSLFGYVDSNQDSLISLMEASSGLARLGQQMSGESDTLIPSDTKSPQAVFEAADLGHDKRITSIYSDGDKVVSGAEVDASQRQVTEQSLPTEVAASDITGMMLSQDWQEELLNSLLKGLNEVIAAAKESTSLYA